MEGSGDVVISSFPRDLPRPIESFLAFIERSLLLFGIRRGRSPAVVRSRMERAQKKRRGKGRCTQILWGTLNTQMRVILGRE